MAPVVESPHPVGGPDDHVDGTAIQHLLTPGAHVTAGRILATHRPDEPVTVGVGLLACHPGQDAIEIQFPIVASASVCAGHIPSLSQGRGTDDETAHLPCYPRCQRGLAEARREGFRSAAGVSK